MFAINFLAMYVIEICPIAHCPSIHVPTHKETYTTWQECKRGCSFHKLRLQARGRGIHQMSVFVNVGEDRGQGFVNIDKLEFY